MCATPVSCCDEYTEDGDYQVELGMILPKHTFMHKNVSLVLC